MMNPRILWCTELPPVLPMSGPINGAAQSRHSTNTESEQPASSGALQRTHLPRRVADGSIELPATAAAPPEPTPAPRGPCTLPPRGEWLATHRAQGEPVANHVAIIREDLGATDWGPNCALIEWTHNPVPVGEMLSWQEQPGLAHPDPRVAALEAALTALVRKAQAVADDCHKPRYARLDEALASARAALGEEK